MDDISNLEFKDPLELDIFEQTNINDFSNEIEESFIPKELNENYNKYFRKRRDSIESLYDEIDDSNKKEDPYIDSILSQF